MLQESTAVKAKADKVKQKNSYIFKKIKAKRQEKRTNLFFRQRTSTIANTLSVRLGTQRSAYHCKPTLIDHNGWNLPNGHHFSYKQADKIDANSIALFLG